MKTFDEVPKRDKAGYPYSPAEIVMHMCAIEHADMRECVIKVRDWKMCRPKFVLPFRRCIVEAKRIILDEYEKQAEAQWQEELKWRREYKNKRLIDAAEAKNIETEKDPAPDPPQTEK